MEIPKISVLIICYKQENLIKRAINSLLAQKDYIYEICVSDDCSPDRTWEVLQEYEKLYPGLFKLHQNRPNVGIFENIEYTWTMPKGDVIYQLSGDDEVGEDWFRTVVEYIQQNNIDYKNELFCIYGDYSCVYPNGDCFIFSNKRVLSKKDPIRLSLRGLIGSRSACYSRKVLEKFIPVSQGRSYIAEVAQDRQLQIFSKKNYYIPQIGNKYFANVGVSVSTIDKHYSERQLMMDYFVQFLKKQGIDIHPLDINYINYFNLFNTFLYSKKIYSLVHALYYLLLGCTFTWGDGLLNIKHLSFAFIRRLPHSKPIVY